ncbi:hypothetical protein ACFVXR_25255 [Bacillus thuringiensis]|nr:hypothetical protein [Bacillus thuringiensis]
MSIEKLAVSRILRAVRSMNKGSNKNDGNTTWCLRSDSIINQSKGR